jgi:hypothetical protein
MARRPPRPSGRKAKAPRASARTSPSGGRSRSGSATPRKARKPKKTRGATSKRKAATPRLSEEIRGKSPRLDRARRLLETEVPTPPSSLDLKRQGSAVRTGRHEMEEFRRQHAGMSPAITAGDVDADLESAYFSGEEAAGGDNPTPDQGIVDDIGRALGVEYHDNEELRSSDKVVERDRHRWERDPASSEDYRDRK